MGRVGNDSTQRTRGILIEEREVVVGRRILLDETDSSSMVMLTFPKTLQVFRETCATAFAKLDDEVVKSSSTHSDFYGYLTSIANPLVTALDWSAKYGGTMAVELELEVTQLYGVATKPTEYEASWPGHFYTAPPFDWMNVTAPEQLATAQAKVDEKDWVAALSIRPDDFSSSTSKVILWSSTEGKGEDALQKIEQRLRDQVPTGICPPNEGDDWFEQRMIEVRKCFEKV